METFLPARTELDPGRTPRGTQTPTYFTQHILPPKKESTALSCISKANGTLVFSLPNKDHVGSAHLWSRKKTIDVVKETRHRQTLEPHRGAPFPALGVARWEILPLTHQAWLLGTWVSPQTHSCPHS